MVYTIVFSFRVPLFQESTGKPSSLELNDSFSLGNLRQIKQNSSYSFIIALLINSIIRLCYFMYLSMPTLVESRLGNLWRSLRGERCQCFHCGEQMRIKNALSISVQGVQQPMCCHGCLAIVQTVLRNDLLEEYLANKSTVNPVVKND